MRAHLRQLFPRRTIQIACQTLNLLPRHHARAQRLVRLLARGQKRLAGAIAVRGSGSGGAGAVFVFDGGGDLGEGVWGDVDGGGVNEGNGELDFEVFGGEGGGEADVEEVADAEEAA